MANLKTNIVIGNPQKPVRLSYLKAWEPGETPSGDLKYGCSILVPVGNKADLAAIDQAIKAAIQQGLDKGTFTKAHLKSLRMPTRNGSEEFANEAKGKEYDGMIFMNASSKNPPGIVDSNARPIMNQDDLYSGVWALADVNFFPYHAGGNRGIGVGLNNIMKVRDDERLDGKRSAEEAFSKFAINDAEVEDTEGELE